VSDKTSIKQILQDIIVVTMRAHHMFTSLLYYAPDNIKPPKEILEQAVELSWQLQRGTIDPHVDGSLLELVRDDMRIMALEESGKYNVFEVVLEELCLKYNLSAEQGLYLTGMIMFASKVHKFDVQFKAKEGEAN
jgi:hypothetical protein